MRLGADLTRPQLRLHPAGAGGSARILCGVINRIVATLVCLAWSLWFGGAVMVFITAASLFSTFAPDRATAGRAAAGMFRTWERYQLILAAVALVLTVLWRVLPGAPKLKTGVFTFFAVATLLGVYSTMRVTPRINSMRREGLTMTDPQFRRLHGTSNALYTAGAAALLGAGVLLPLTVRRDGGEKARGKTDDAAPAVDSPAV